MRKATIFDINHKKNQQVADDVSMTPAERIDRMFELMELFADLHPSKTLLHHNPASKRNYIEVRKKPSAN